MKKSLCVQNLVSESALASLREAASPIAALFWGAHAETKGASIGPSDEKSAKTIETP